MHHMQWIHNAYLSRVHPEITIVNNKQDSTEDKLHSMINS